jgi:hypothetical protein
MSFNKNLKGIYGIAWSASNKNIPYCDDWCSNAYCNAFSQNGRGDLQRLKNLGFNLVRTYYWDPERSHQLFLQEADRVKIGVEVPISNNLVSSRDIRSITKLVNEAKVYNCVKVYTVGNEMSGNDADNIAWALAEVAKLDPDRPVMHSSIYDDSFATMKNIIRRLDEFTFQRFIAGINMYFYSNNPRQWGDCLQGSVNKWYKDPMLKNIPMIISEIGYAGNNEDASFDAIHNTLYGGFCAIQNFPNFLGLELFSWRNERWKGASSNESSYGLCQEDDLNTPRKQYYAVQNFKNAGFYDAIMKQFRPYQA